jgi:hypothetical protein
MEGRGRSAGWERLEASRRRKKLERVVELRSIDGLGEAGGLHRVGRRRRGSYGGGDRIREGSPARRSLCRAWDPRRAGARAGRGIADGQQLVQIAGSPASSSSCRPLVSKRGCRTLIAGPPASIMGRSLIAGRRAAALITGVCWPFACRCRCADHGRIGLASCL